MYQTHVCMAPVFRKTSLGMTLTDLEGPEVDTTDVEGVHRKIFRAMLILYFTDNFVDS